MPELGQGPGQQPFSLAGVIASLQAIAQGIQQVVKAIGTSFANLNAPNTWTGTNNFTAATTFNGTVALDGAVTANSTVALTGVTTISTLRYTVRIVTAAGAVTVTAADNIVEINKTVGAATVANLPAGVVGMYFVIIDGKGDGNTHSITITPTAGNINGAGTYVINTSYGYAQVFYDGGQWLVL